MRENRPSGLEGGEGQLNGPPLPLSTASGPPNSGEFGYTSMNNPGYAGDRRRRHVTYATGAAVKRGDRHVAEVVRLRRRRIGRRSDSYESSGSQLWLTFSPCVRSEERRVGKECR